MEKSKEDTESKASYNSEEEGGTWGLVIIVSAFMLQVFTFGTNCSIGVYATEFLDYFDNDVSGVSLLASVNMTFFMAGGLLANTLASKFSHRLIVLIGGASTVTGLFIMAWLDSLSAMLPFYGVLVGLGCCFAYAPSHTLSGLYYNKYRSLATGLATSGSGLGTAIFPPLVNFLIETYSWRGSLIFLAGLNLHIFVFALLLLPPPSQPVVEVAGGNVEAAPTLSKAQLWRKKYCLCQWDFDLYLISNVLWNCGASVYLTFGPDFFKSLGHSAMDASVLMTIFGLGEFIGGIFGGIVGNIPRLNRIVIYVISCLVGGTMFFFFPMTESFAALAALSFFFGIGFGILLGLLIVVMTDIIGMDNIGIGLGYVLIADGVGVFLGPAIAGAIYDEFDGYDEALYFAGFLVIIAGPLMVPVLLKRCLCGEAVPIGGSPEHGAASQTPSPPGSPIGHARLERQRLSDVAVRRGRNALSLRRHSVRSNEGKMSSSDHKMAGDEGVPAGSHVAKAEDVTLEDNVFEELENDVHGDKEKVSYQNKVYEMLDTEEQENRATVRAQIETKDKEIEITRL